MFTTADLPVSLRPGTVHECGRPDCTFGTEAPANQPQTGVPSLG